MNRSFHILFITILLFSSALIAEDYPNIELVPEEVEVSIGDTIIFDAKLNLSSENSLDTTFTWYLNPSNLGLLENDQTFIATRRGSGYIYAQLDTLIDSAYIKIEGDEDYSKPKLKIIHESKIVFLNDTTEFKLVYCDSSETDIDTIGTWNVVPDSIGLFFHEGKFVANTLGNATIYAALGELTDSLDIEIRDKNQYDLCNKLVLVPEDTVLNLGNSFQYEAKSINDDGLFSPVIPNLWELEGMDIGTIDNDGNFTSKNVGFGLVKAISDSNIGTSFIIVEDSSNDAELNEITITKNHNSPNKEFKIIKTISEGEKWKIGGLPHPLNIYNGGMIYFPVGSLSEDIRIHVDIPKFAKDRGDSVEMGQKGKKLLNAINFQVYTNDTTLVEPYYFDTPLIVSLIYKQGLLKQYDIDPLDLNLYYVNNDSNDLNPDTTGISNTILDYYHNTIYSQVAHFSTLAIMGNNSSVTNISNKDKLTFPKKFELYQNYPNPFNPTTTVKFKIIEPGFVKIDIYNILGEKVEELIKNDFATGTHFINWKATDLSSGFYYIKMTFNGKTLVVRSLLLK